MTLHLRHLLSPILVPLTRKYLSKERTYHRYGLNLVIPPGIFHPGLFYSTNYLIDFLSHFDLKDKTLLELGCGSGMISLFAAQSGAIITAVDLNEKAVACTRGNAERNHLTMDVFVSDLFDRIPMEQNFDFMVINPPYYPKAVESASDMAWNCGEDFEYFRKLFRQLPARLSEQTQCFMVLSEDCDIEKIRSLAEEAGLKFNVIEERKFLLEVNRIYRITL